MTPDARIRRLQDTLIIAGNGVIAFSMWTIAKTALFFVFSNEDWLRQLFDLQEAIPLMIVYVLVAILLCIDLAFRAFIGISARSEGLGKKKSPFYLFVAVFAAIVNVFSVISLIQGSSLSLSPLDTAISAIIEATSFATLILLVYCSVRLRNLRKASD